MKIRNFSAVFLFALLLFGISCTYQDAKEEVDSMSKYAQNENSDNLRPAACKGDYGTYAGETGCEGSSPPCACKEIWLDEIEINGLD